MVESIGVQEPAGPVVGEALGNSRIALDPRSERHPVEHGSYQQSLALRQGMPMSAQGLVSISLKRLSYPPPRQCVVEVRQPESRVRCDGAAVSKGSLSPAIGAQFTFAVEEGPECRKRLGGHRGQAG